MSYALSYNDPRAIPVGILLTYILLSITKWFLKYAQILWPQRPQQTDFAVQEDTSSTAGIAERDSSTDWVFRPDQKVGSTTEKLYSTISTPGGTPPEQSTSSQENQQVQMELRTKPAKHIFGHRYPKAVMADYPNNIEKVTETSEEVMMVPNYVKAVKSGKIPKGPNHAVIEKLVKKPQHHRRR